MANQPFKFKILFLATSSIFSFPLPIHGQGNALTDLGKKVLETLSCALPSPLPDKGSKNCQDPNPLSSSATFIKSSTNGNVGRQKTEECGEEEGVGIENSGKSGLSCSTEQSPTNLSLRDAPHSRVKRGLPKELEELRDEIHSLQNTINGLMLTSNRTPEQSRELLYTTSQLTKSMDTYFLITKRLPPGYRWSTPSASTNNPYVYREEEDSLSDLARKISFWEGLLTEKEQQRLAAEGSHYTLPKPQNIEGMRNILTEMIANYRQRYGELPQNIKEVSSPPYHHFVYTDPDSAEVSVRTCDLPSITASENKQTMGSQCFATDTMASQTSQASDQASPSSLFQILTPLTLPEGMRFLRPIIQERRQNYDRLLKDEPSSPNTSEAGIKLLEVLNLYLNKFEEWPPGYIVKITPEGDVIFQFDLLAFNVLKLSVELRDLEKKMKQLQKEGKPKEDIEATAGKIRDTKTVLKMLISDYTWKYLDEYPPYVQQIEGGGYTITDPAYPDESVTICQSNFSSRTSDQCVLSTYPTGVLSVGQAAREEEIRTQAPDSLFHELWKVYNNVDVDLSWEERRDYISSFQKVLTLLNDYHRDYHRPGFGRYHFDEKAGNWWYDHPLKGRLDIPNFMGDATDNEKFLEAQLRNLFKLRSTPPKPPENIDQHRETIDRRIGSLVQTYQTEHNGQIPNYLVAEWDDENNRPIYLLNPNPRNNQTETAQAAAASPTIFTLPICPGGPSHRQKRALTENAPCVEPKVVEELQVHAFRKAAKQFQPGLQAASKQITELTTAFQRRQDLTQVYRLKAIALQKHKADDPKNPSPTTAHALNEAMGHFSRAIGHFRDKYGTLPPGIETPATGEDGWNLYDAPEWQEYKATQKREKIAKIYSQYQNTSHLLEEYRQNQSASSFRIYKEALKATIDLLDQFSEEYGKYLEAFTKLTKWKVAFTHNDDYLNYQKDPAAYVMPDYKTEASVNANKILDPLWEKLQKMSDLLAFNSSQGKDTDQSPEKKNYEELKLQVQNLTKRVCEIPGMCKEMVQISSTYYPIKNFDFILSDTHKNLRAAYANLDKARGAEKESRNLYNLHLVAKSLEGSPRLLAHSLARGDVGRALKEFRDKYGRYPSGFKPMGNNDYLFNQAHLNDDSTELIEEEKKADDMLSQLAHAYNKAISRRLDKAMQETSPDKAPDSEKEDPSVQWSQKLRDIFEESCTALTRCSKGIFSISGTKKFLYAENTEDIDRFLMPPWTQQPALIPIWEKKEETELLKLFSEGASNFKQKIKIFYKKFGHLPEAFIHQWNGLYMHIPLVVEKLYTEQKWSDLFSLLETYRNQHEGRLPLDFFFTKSADGNVLSIAYSPATESQKRKEEENEIYSLLNSDKKATIKVRDTITLKMKQYKTKYGTYPYRCKEQPLNTSGSFVCVLKPTPPQKSGRQDGDL